jgi:hypothetical protein
MPQLSKILSALALCACLALPSGCSKPPHQAGHVLDEARTAQRAPESFPAAAEDYFHDMDGAIGLTADEIKGRNTWIVWTGGNDRLWDRMTGYTFGALDLLKMISSHPHQPVNRESRWQYLGLVNEPCFDAPSGPNPERFGLWLDVRQKDCPADPFEDEKKYPGVRIGARGDTVPVGSFYGYASGVVGLRLFPNPQFDESARKNWDPERYYTDPAYYQRKDLIRPYRVGMSCGFCHVGPNPVRPPVDPAHPQWSNLSSAVGAQYMWVDRLFISDASSDNFMFQLLHTYRPGTMDTSLIATDNINNPRSMNALYLVGPRLDQGRRWGKEQLAGGDLHNKQFNDFVKQGPLTQFFDEPDTVWAPHILKDGADSVGVLGALNRVYVNIGLFSDEWLLHFNPVVGGKRPTPFEIEVAEKNSSYWQATEAQTPATALFFLKATGPHLLKDAPGGERYLTHDQALLNRGKTVFAESCARCHSSKAPTPAVGLDPAGCPGAEYLTCWNKYWDWTKTDDYKRQMRAIVNAPDFLEGNYLSTDFRVPVTLLGTNACSPLATNALEGHIWDNFSSRTYKDLPSVGTITIYDPFTGEPKPYKMPAGGRGYTRSPSLVSLWSTAPFLLNNSVGPFDSDPSVDARMRVFQASIEQLLWPEKRQHDSVLGDKVPGTIDRTTARSWIRIPAGYVPEALQRHRGLLERWFPSLVGDGGGLVIGPIPAGIPVNLLANLQPLAETSDPAALAAHAARLADLILHLTDDLSKLPPNATDDEARTIFANLVEPMMALSKCPDFVVNRGHYFGTSYGKGEALSDADKRALIEFLKTF